MNKYKRLYFDAAWQFIAQMQAELDRATAKENEANVVKTMRRLAHSMKSRSLIMGFVHLGHMSKALEFYFRDIEEGRKSLSDDTRVLIATILDQIDASLKMIKEEKPEKNMTQYIAQLEQLP